MVHKPYCPSPMMCNCYPMGGDPMRITEDVVYDHGDVVLSHQKRADGTHRLILCRTPPQKVGEWASCNVWATVEGYRASWDKGVDGGTKVR